VRPLNVFPDPQTYPGVLQAELTARYTAQTPTVANAGCPGEKITDRGTLKRFSDDTGGGRYGAVLILEGANDLESRDATVVPAAIAGLRQMVGYARMGNVRPYLATLTPMNPAGSRGGAWSLVPGFNDQIRILANSEGVTLVDVNQALNVDISTYIGFDGLHPTAQGYAKIADTFFAAVRQTLETLVPSSRGVVKGNLLGRRIQSPSGAAVVTCSPP